MVSRSMPRRSTRISLRRTAARPDQIGQVSSEVGCAAVGGTARAPGCSPGDCGECSSWSQRWRFSTNGVDPNGCASGCGVSTGGQSDSGFGGTSGISGSVGIASSDANDGSTACVLLNACEQCACLKCGVENAAFTANAGCTAIRDRVRQTNRTSILRSRRSRSVGASRVAAQRGISGNSCPHG